MIRKLMTVLVALVLTGFAAEARAQQVVVQATAPAPVVVESAGGADRPGFSVAGLAGLEFAGSGVGALFDFGARAGYTLPMHLYIGGDLGYALAGFGGIFHLQAEVGYALGIRSVPQLLIRPYGGIGFALFHAGGAGGGNECVTVDGMQICSNVSGGGGGNAGGFLFSPGTVVAYSVTPNFFVGGDVRIPIYAASGYTTAGFDLLGTAGYAF
jgi:hypothetical protein